MKISWRSIIIIGLCLILVFIGLRILDSNLLALFSTQNKSFPLEEKWSLDLPENIQEISNPNGSLVIARGTYTLFAIDIKKGTVLWKFRLHQQVGKSPALIQNGTVFVADSSNVYAINAETGKGKWEQLLTEKGGGDVRAVSKSIVVVNQIGYDIRVYDSDTGKFLWRISTGRGGRVAEIMDDVVITNTWDNEFEAYDVKTGELKWKIGNELGTPWYHIGDIYYFFSDNRVFASRPFDPSTLWTTNIPKGSPREIYGNNDFLFLATVDSIYSIYRESGRINWQIKAAEPVNLNIIGNTLYYREWFRNRIKAVDIQTGKDLGVLVFTLPKIVSAFYQDMVASEDLLIFSSHRKLYGFGPKVSP